MYDLFNIKELKIFAQSISCVFYVVLAIHSINHGLCSGDLMCFL
jgi:hypothetical protein